MRWTGMLLLSGFILLRPSALAPSPNSSPIRLVDVAAEAGLKFQHMSGSAEKQYILESMSGGVAWIDYDRDGWPDLYLVKVNPAADGTETAVPLSVQAP